MLRSKFICGFSALALLMGAGVAQARSVPADKAAIEAQLNTFYPHLDALYKDIHAHPELGFQETETAKKLAAEMRALGFTVTEHIAGTGIVAIYKNGPGPTVMVRTEMDALPMEEKTGLSYASHVIATWNGKQTPVDHACGHDIHMAAWVGTAQALVATVNDDRNRSRCEPGEYVTVTTVSSGSTVTALRVSGRLRAVRQALRPTRRATAAPASVRPAPIRSSTAPNTSAVERAGAHQPC